MASTKKQTLTATTPDGKTFTRKTHRAYTHVAAAYGPTAHWFSSKEDADAKAAKCADAGTKFDRLTPTPFDASGPIVDAPPSKQNQWQTATLPNGITFRETAWSPYRSTGYKADPQRVWEGRSYSHVVVTWGWMVTWHGSHDLAMKGLRSNTKHRPHHTQHIIPVNDPTAPAPKPAPKKAAPAPAPKADPVAKLKAKASHRAPKTTAAPSAADEAAALVAEAAQLTSDDAPATSFWNTFGDAYAAIMEAGDISIGDFGRGIGPGGDGRPRYNMSASKVKGLVKAGVLVQVPDTKPARFVLSADYEDKAQGKWSADTMIIRGGNHNVAAAQAARFDNLLDRFEALISRMEATPFA